MKDESDIIRNLIESAETETESLKDRALRLLEDCIANFEIALRDHGTDLETRISIASTLAEIVYYLPEELTEEEVFERTGSYAGTVGD